MTNVIRLVEHTKTVETILADAKARDLESVLIMGWTKDGELYTNGSGDTASENLLIDLVKTRLLSIALGDDPCPTTS
jgi:hypothetical protein